MELKELLSNDFKVYVDVYELHTKDGKITPIGFVWENGLRYAVDKVTDIRRAASLKAGGAGLRYTVKIGNFERFMFLEEEAGVRRWFMERK
ncbi:MAG: hypothetical protein LBL87_01115 [Ruminococcus sp.]|jgi:hypothetical protein|nr:hypothetical protein [Ruminococcus sp.]